MEQGKGQKGEGRQATIICIVGQASPSLVLSLQKERWQVLAKVGLRFALKDGEKAPEGVPTVPFPERKEAVAGGRG